MMDINETNVRQGYADVNGLKMYFEIYGTGSPLVLVHGGGSTIETSFGRIIHQLARQRQVIAVELQAHGRTSDRNTALSFAQDADDLAALLASLNIARADFFGFSNGGTTLLQLAIRHPAVVNKMILASAMYKREGVPAPFWDFMDQATIDHMPQPYKDAYHHLAPEPANLLILHNKCRQRMIDFIDISEEQMRSIQSPAFVVCGDQDVMTPEHAVDIYRLIPGSRLLIFPGGHGQYMGEITTLTPDYKGSDCLVSLVEEFLSVS